MNKISYIYHRLAPNFVKKCINPDSFLIQNFIVSEIQKTGWGDKILDAGAGESRYRKFTTNQMYIAFDAACGDASWDYSKLDVIANLENTPFRRDIFDLVICTQVLEHVKEPQITLQELFRVAKAGGAICISAPQGWGVHQAPFDFFRYTHFGLRYLLEKAGFEIISITPSCGYFSYLANRLTVFPKTLFWQIRTGWIRLLLSPFEFLSYIVFVFLLPLFLNSMDFLDRDQNYTLNYIVLAKKPQSSETQS